MKQRKILSWMLALLILFTAFPVDANESQISTQTISVNKGEKIQLTTGSLEEIVYQYVSENEEVAVVDQNGKITAVGEGMCNIVATAYYGTVEIASKMTPVTVQAEDDEEDLVPKDPDTSEVEGMTTFIFQENQITVIEGTDKEYGIVNKEGDDITAAGTDENGNFYYVAAEGDVAAVEIGKKGGSYMFEGTASDSSICVKKGATKDAVLYLNGLEMTSSYTSPIQVKKDSSAKVYIIAMEGTVNKLEDNVYNNDDNYPENAAAENAVIKAKAGCDVIIGGTGTLEVIGNGKNGIKAANKLTIQDVNLLVRAENNAIASDTEMMIQSGTFQLESGNDGIKSCNDDAPVGRIRIEGGNFTIDSVGDCIVATETVEITGGEFDLTAYDGYDAQYDGDDEAYPSAKGLKASGSYIVKDETTGEETEVDYVKENQLNISGGKFVINTADDAIHSDGNLTITGGEFEIKTGDDGIHADYVTTLGSEDSQEKTPVVEVLNCVEGIEGATVIIYNGDYTLYCSDDIINAANADISGWTYEISIYGGNFFGSTYMGDGYDSNNQLNLYGGTHIIMSDTGQGEANEALDCDGSLTLAGATILTIGRSGMGTRYSSASTNAYVTFGGGSGMGGGFPGRPGQTTQSSVSIANGNTVAIKDAAGQVLLETVAVWDEKNNGRNASYVMYSAPDLSSGSSLSLFVNETQTATATAQNSGSGWRLAAAADTIESNDGIKRLVIDVEQAERPQVMLEWRYTSGDESIITISEQSEMHALKLGKTTITLEVLVNEVLVEKTVYHVCVSTELPFIDVDEDAWYRDAIEYVYDRELMTGTDDLFKPAEAVTRAQFVTVLYRLAGKPEITDKSALEVFSDVAEGEYYTEAVCWAYHVGVGTGYDGKFNPTASMSRQQMATFLFRYAELMGLDTEVRADYSDMLNAEEVYDYADEAISWAVGSGFISGSQKTDEAGNVIYDLNPRGNTTRAQFATILQRFCEANAL